MRRSELHEIQGVAVVSAKEDAARRHARALEAVATRSDDAVSLLLAVPFCAAHCLICARPVQAAQPAAAVAAYVDTLVLEATRLADRIGAGRDVLQLHLGGGSVAEIGDGALLKMCDALHRLFRLPADCDRSVDCDPRRVTEGRLRLLAAMGFRRIRFGLFDLDPEVQQASGRINTEALLDDACALARGAGFRTVTLVLMIGLPRQTPERWARTLEHVVALGADRLLLERYVHDPHRAPAQHAIDADELPSPETVRQLRAQTHRRLVAAGYVAIGDDYVLDSDELLTGGGPLRRSPIGPTTMPPTPLLGLGAGALSQIDGAVYGHTPATGAWKRAVEAGRSPVVHLRPGPGAPLLHIGEVP